MCWGCSTTYAYLTIFSRMASRCGCRTCGRYGLTGTSLGALRPPACNAGQRCVSVLMMVPAALAPEGGGRALPPPLTDGGPELPRMTKGGPVLPRMTDGGPVLPRMTDGGPVLPSMTDGGPVLPRMTDGGPVLPRMTDGGPHPAPGRTGPCSPCAVSCSRSCSVCWPSTAPCCTTPRPTCRSRSGRMAGPDPGSTMPADPEPGSTMPAWPRSSPYSSTASLQGPSTTSSAFCASPATAWRRRWWMS